MNAFLHRTLSLSLAVIVTLITFAAIDALATEPAGNALLAQTANAQRA